MRGKLEKIKKYFQKNRQPSTLMLVLFSFCVFAVLLIPRFSFAEATWYNPMTYGDAIGDYVINAFMNMANGILQLGIWLVNIALSYTNTFFTKTASYDPMKAWGNIRNLSLSLFGIAVLIIAFMNLLRLQIQVWGVNRMIPKLFLAIFLVIFSKFVCISIINFATALANTFTQTLDFTKFGASLNAATAQEITSPSLGTAIAVFICAAIAFLILFLLAVVLFFRAIVLAFLVIVSPLAFALTVLPWTQKYFQEWWKTFLKWTFFFPVCIIILSIGFSLIPDASSAPAQVPSPGDASASVFFNQFSLFFVALAAIVMSIFVPLKMLGAFGSVAQDVLSGKKGIPGAPVDMKSIRDWGQGRSKKIGTRKADRVSRAMRRPFANTRVGTFITGEDALDAAAIRDEKAGLVKNNLSVDQQRLIAQHGGDINALRGTNHELSDVQERWYRGFTSRGGGHEDIVRNLANNGDLNHETALAGRDYLENQMDLNTALKKSNLHHLRQGGNYPLGNLSDEQLGKMVPSDIRRINNLGGTTPAFATMIAGSRKMSPAQKMAAAVVFGANGRHEEQAIINNALNQNRPGQGGGGQGGGQGGGAPTPQERMRERKQEAMDNMNQNLP